MDKVIRIISQKAEKSDFIFWKNKSFAERIDAIEFLRNQYYSLSKNVQQRFQRVCRVVDKV